jgi:hypothetical protein
MVFAGYSVSGFVGFTDYAMSHTPSPSTNVHDWPVRVLTTPPPSAKQRADRY